MPPDTGHDRTHPRATSAVHAPDTAAARRRARKPRADGMRSRQAIVLAAARIASIRGLEGVTIGALAKELGMSKSGLFAHFGSKEELELAAVDAAEALFAEQVVIPTRQAKPGLARLHMCVDTYINHVRGGAFPGGCFFAAVAAGAMAQPDRVRDRVLACIAAWKSLLDQCVREAIDLGELRPDVDGEQVVFEVGAVLQASNSEYVLTRNPAAFARAHRSIEGLLNRAAPEAGRRLLAPRARTGPRVPARSPAPRR